MKGTFLIFVMALSLSQPASGAVVLVDDLFNCYHEVDPTKPPLTFEMIQVIPDAVVTVPWSFLFDGITFDNSKGKIQWQSLIGTKPLHPDLRVWTYDTANNLTQQIYCSWIAVPKGD
jgi:hypothetical protein